MRQTYFAVVLTHSDVLRDKISQYGVIRTLACLKHVWHDYNGTASYDDIIAFIKQK